MIVCIVAGIIKDKTYESKGSQRESINTMFLTSVSWFLCDVDVSWFLCDVGRISASPSSSAILY